VPTSDGEVIERVPESLSMRTLAGMRSTDARSSPDITARVVRAQLTLAARSADPRFLGYAQASLSTWWSDAAPPVAIALVRAELKQKRHEFAAALIDFDYVLARAPRNVEALLSSATVHQVLGEYDTAALRCQRLRAAAEVIGTVCAQSVRSMRGEAEQAYASLNGLLKTTAWMPRALSAWTHATAADVAQRLGRIEEAAAHFKASLENEDNPYVVNAYADLLIDAGRAREAEELLAKAGNNDGVLLRLAVTSRALRKNADSHASALLERFDSYDRRGDLSHLRDQSRYALQIKGDARSALALALRNWRQQREPADARLVLESAATLNDPLAARPVLDALARTHLQDRELERLARELSGS